MKLSTRLIKLLIWSGFLLSLETITAQDIVVEPLDIIACLGETDSFFIVATGNTPFTFKWFKDPGVEIVDGWPFSINNTQNSSTLIIAPVAATHAGMYYATVTQSNPPGSVNSQTVSLSVDSIAAANAGPDMTLTCDMQEVTLNGTGSTQGPGITYKWTLNNDIVGTTNTVNVDETGTYVLTVTNDCGSTTDTVLVTSDFSIPTGLAILPPQPLLTCSQPSLELEASSTSVGITGKWNGPGITDSPGTKLTVNMPGEYTFTAKLNATGCSDSVTITVEQDLSDFPSAVVQPAEELTCIKSCVDLIAQNPQNSTSYGWFDSNDNLIIAQLTASVCQPAEYIFKIDNNNCKKEYSVTVTQNITPPSLSLDPPLPAICEGFTLDLTASGADSYVWGGPVVSDNNSIEVTQAGTYYVTATDNQNGCTATQSVVISQRPTPHLDGIVGTKEIVAKNGSQSNITLSASPSPSEVEWEVKQALLNVNDFNPKEGIGDISQVFSLKETRAAGRVTYNIRANNQGCIGDSAIIIVKVLPDNGDDLFIPEIIAPNGDGQNDTWNVIPADGVELTKVILFNRAGGKVFEGASGTEWRAENCPGGIYFYVISYTLNGNRTVLKGAVTVLKN
jgi:gliding motility-associated-like protein